MSKNSGARPCSGTQTGSIEFSLTMPARRLGALQFGKVKIADSTQGSRRGALGQIVGQAVEPCPPLAG
jgi:hypothetical protein